MTLPVHPLPAEGGLLSDYMVRLALANRIRPTRLTSFLGLPRLWQRDPDRTLPPEKLDVLAERIGICPEALRATTLQPMIRNLHGDVPPDTALTRFIVVSGRHTREPGSYGHPVCPDCLRDGRPLQRTWRLTTTVRCPIHGALMDTCQRCGSLVNHLRPYMRAGKTPPLPYRPHLCSGCGEHLVAPECQSDAGLWLQEAMCDAAIHGTARWGDHSLPARDFQGVVEAMMRLSNPPEAANHARWRPETANVEVRRAMVARTGQVMAGGLSPCLSRLQAQGVDTVRLLARVQAGIVPKWFAEAAHDALSRRPHAGRTRQTDPTFRFTDKQWANIRPLLPPEPATGGSRAGRKAHRQVLEDFFSRCAAGTTDGRWSGSVSLPTLRRRLWKLAHTGTLDSVIQAMLDSPTRQTWSILTAPETLRQLRRMSVAHADHLAKAALKESARSVERRLQARNWPPPRREDCWKLQDREESRTPACNEGRDAQ